jgi:hypothetical protein
LINVLVVTIKGSRWVENIWRGSKHEWNYGLEVNERKCGLETIEVSYIDRLPLSESAGYGKVIMGLGRAINHQKEEDRRRSWLNSPRTGFLHHLCFRLDE